MATVAAGMVRRGHAVAFAFDPRAPIGERLDAGVVGVPIRIRNDGDPAAVARLRRLIVRHGADVVVVNTTRELRVGGIAARLAGRGAVVNRRGAGDVLRGGLWDRWLYHALIDVLVRDSQWGVDAIAAQNPWFRRPTHVARNGLDVEAVSRTTPSDRAAFGGVPGEFIIAVSDRRGRPAGAPEVAEAARRVVATSPGAPIHIVVVGDVDDSVRDATNRALDGEDRVRASFVGPLPSADALEMTAAADIFARPSRSDGIPYAVLEAMALQLPVVASAQGGLAEVVADGETGILTPVGDVAALAAAIERLRADPALRAGMGRAAWERVRLEFSESKMLDAYEAVFRSAARIRGRGA